MFEAFPSLFAVGKVMDFEFWVKAIQKTRIQRQFSWVIVNQKHAATAFRHGGGRRLPLPVVHSVLQRGDGNVDGKAATDTGFGSAGEAVCHGVAEAFDDG